MSNSIVEELNRLTLRGCSEPQFKYWSTSTVDILFTNACGYNGYDARDLSVKLLEEYYQWYLININENIQMYPCELLIKMLLFVKSIKTSDITIDSGKNQRYALKKLSEFSRRGGFR